MGIFYWDKEEYSHVWNNSKAIRITWNIIFSRALESLQELENLDNLWYIRNRMRSIFKVKNFSYYIRNSFSSIFLTFYLIKIYFHCHQNTIQNILNSYHYFIRHLEHLSRDMLVPLEEARKRRDTRSLVSSVTLLY